MFTYIYYRDALIYIQLYASIKIYTLKHVHIKNTVQFLAKIIV